MGDMPQFSASAYVNSTTTADQLWSKAGSMDQIVGGLLNAAQNKINNQQQTQPENQMSQRRIVKVFVVDSNENLPLEKCVLYSGDEKLTDCTDQELFFEIPMQQLLADHNTYRATVVDKKQAEKFGRDIFLEPAKIRDLKMVVTTVANF